jgi:rhodanese-related sulfurtransferase
VPYAGDLGPEETYRLLESEPEAVLVDVRTEAEWAYVGVPDLGALGRDAVLVEWQSFPGQERNPDFVADLRRAGLRPETPVAFLCRSGVRSLAAAEAATAAGWQRAYNVSGGFEGGHDEAGHRGTTSGWKAAGLPWKQS